MKKIAAFALAGALAFGLSACEMEETTNNGDYGTSGNNSGGMGMTYNGKLGYDLGGGLVLGSDGKVGLGFGF